MYPSKLPLKTSLGTLELAVTSGCDICASSDDIVWRGVHYVVNFHVSRQDDGSFAPQHPGNSSITRRGHFKDGSQAAQAAIKRVVLPALDEWGRREYESGTAFFYAHYAKVMREIKHRDDMIAALRDQIRKLEEEKKAVRAVNPPPDNRSQDPQPTPTEFEAYKVAFQGEWLRANCTDECTFPDDDIRRFFEQGVGVRTAAMEVSQAHTDKVLLCGNVFDHAVVGQGFASAVNGLSLDQNPYPQGKTHNLRWKRGYGYCRNYPTQKEK